MIQTIDKADSEKVISEVNKRCHNTLIAEKGKKYRPRMIMYDIPDDITKENIIQVIKDQNSEIIEDNNYLEVKTILKQKSFTGKQEIKNAIIEVDPGLRKKMLEVGKLKCRWVRCKVNDNIYIRRCFTCSRFHGGDKCQNKLSCPRCCGEHDLKSCTVERHHFKCINCVKYNERTKSSNHVNTGHAATDKQCPSYLAVRNRIIQTIDYDV